MAMLTTLTLCAAVVATLSGPPASANTGGTAIAPASDLARGLTDRLVGTVAAPTDIAFLPNGRGLVAARQGKVRLIVDGDVRSGAVLNVSDRTCSNGERGLLGITVDPNFTNNRWFYVFWTFDKFDSCGEAPAATPVNRVTRFRLGDDGTAVTGSATVVVDNIPSPASNHNAGDLAFGDDALLYVTTGDGGCQLDAPDQCGEDNNNARRLDIPNGKVLRVTRNGGIPDDNPYVEAVDARRCTEPGGPEPGDGPCVETFASGLRNPFRMDMVPGTSTPWVNDVGQSTWEEIDSIEAGADYGWNLREGFCALASTTDCDPGEFADPQFAYDRDGGCRSITGAAFVPPGTWEGRFAGDYVFADFACNSLWRLHDNGELLVAKPLAVAQGPVALAFGPSPKGRALYYLEHFTGEIRFIAQR